jgi:hypothetical protein
MAGVSLGHLRFTLGFDSIQFRKGMSAAERDLVLLQKKFEGFGQKLQGIGMRLSGAITLPLVAFGIKAVKTASDAAELQSAFNTTFGQMATGMNKWAEATGNALGRSTREIQQAANTFGIFFNTAVPPAKAAAMSRTFAVLAQDLASFFNTDTATAIEKLRAGLAGEAEPLRAFGVFLSDAAVKAKGLELGLIGVGETMTEQEKILARYHLILEGTTKAQGDVARTSGSSANQMRAFGAAIEELQQEAGERLLPMFTRLVTALARLVAQFNELPRPAQNAIAATAAFAAAIGPVTWAVGGMVGGLAKSAPLIDKIASSFGAARGALAGATASTMAFSHVLLPLAALIGGVYLAYKNWDKIQPIVDRVKGATDGYFTRVSERFKEFETKWNQNAAEVKKWAGQVDAEFDRPVPKGKAVSVQKETDSMTKFIVGMYRSWNEGSRQLQVALANADRAILNFVITTENTMLRVREAIANMVRSASDWLGAKFNALLNPLKAKVQAIGDWFKDLENRVTGNSYVPDMVNLIGVHFARLGQVMVQPAMAATREAGEEFRRLQEDARARTAEVIDAFGQMAAGTISSVREMVATFKSGDVLSGIQQFLELVLTVIQALGRIGVIKLPGGGVDGARAAGGPVVPGRTYLVGENGPEFITPRRSGFVHPNGTGPGGVSVRVVPSPYFDVVVDGRARNVAAPMAGQAAIGGALGAQQALARRQRMNLAGR